MTHSFNHVPSFTLPRSLLDGEANTKWPEITDTPLWLVYSGDRDLKKAEEVAKAYQAVGKVTRFTGYPEATHNQIHWKLAKGEKVFPWMFEQSRE